MSTGALTIQKLSNPTSDLAVYQVLFEDLAGNLFSGSMNREELTDVLFRELNVMTHTEIADLLSRVDRGGSSTLEDLHIKEGDLAGAGLQYLQRAD